MQADTLNIPNSDGLTYRLAVNEALKANATDHAGTTAPVETWPRMVWLDTSTTPATLRRRNEANNAWEIPAIIADDIFERTAGHGVEIDGVLLKDGRVNGVDVTSISGGVDPDTLTDATLNGSERVAIKQAGGWFRTTIDALKEFLRPSTFTDSGVLDGSEIVTGDRSSGYVGITVNRLAAFVTAIYTIALRSGTGSAARTVLAILRDQPIRPKDFGVVASGFTDDTLGMVNFFTAWIRLSEVTATKVKAEVPAGTYRLSSPVDLSVIFSAQTYYGLDLDMHAGAVFQPVGPGAVTPLLKFAPPAGGQITSSSLKFGQFGGAGITETVGLHIERVTNSLIDIQGAASCTIGVKFGSDLTNGVYNNLIRIGFVLSNTYGVICDDTGVFPHGFQGNIVHIGHLAFNSNQALHLLRQSTSNTFHIASMEGNGTHGVLDQAGYNIFRVNFCTHLATDKIELGTTNGRVDIEGYGLVVLNNVGAVGWVKDNARSTAPSAVALPGNYGTLVNTHLRPTFLTVSGGTVQRIDIGGVTVGTAGTWAVPFGAPVYFEYTVAPTAVWTFL